MPASTSTEARIRRLWQRMTEIYGHRWVSAYGADAAAGAGETWAKGLAGVSDRDIGYGLEQCIVSSEPWPPTLPEFRAMCLDIPAVDDVVAELMQGRGPQTEFGALVFERIDEWNYRNRNARDVEKMVRYAAREVRKEAVREGSGEQAPTLSHDRQALGHEGSR